MHNLMVIHWSLGKEAEGCRVKYKLSINIYGIDMCNVNNEIFTEMDIY